MRKEEELSFELPPLLVLLRRPTTFRDVIDVVPDSSNSVTKILHLSVEILVLLRASVRGGDSRVEKRRSVLELPLDV